MRYVIVGNSAAGVSALEAIREVDQQGEVSVVSNEPYPAYGRVFITRVLRGDCELHDILTRPKDFYEKLRCRVFLGDAATELDPVRKQVTLSSGRVLSYERLLLATGASAYIPTIPGIELDGVRSLRTIDDSREILRHAKTARHAVVMGGGPVGLHSAEAFLKHGIKVTLVIASDHVLSALAPKEATAMMEKSIVARGARLVFGQSVVEVFGEKRVQGVTLDNGQSIPGDMVIVGKGVMPNMGLTCESKIKRGVGIRVDSHQQTDEPDIYAAGDVTESYDLIRKGPRLNAMWPNAVFQGRIAGLNMAGGSATNPGCVNVNTGEVFGVPFAIVGFSSRERIQCREIQLRGIRGYGRVIVSEKLDGIQRLLGAVLIGNTRGAGVLHALIRGRINVTPCLDEIVTSNFSYSALVGSVRKLLRSEAER